MQNFRIGREGFQQLKQLPQVFLHKMVGSVKCNVKETEVLAQGQGLNLTEYFIYPQIAQFMSPSIPTPTWTVPLSTTLCLY